MTEQIAMRRQVRESAILSGECAIPSKLGGLPLNARKEDRKKLLLLKINNAYLSSFCVNNGHGIAKEKLNI